MKSIMQEASSVVKAIEKAWESAGKPKEFSIKVFEEPKRNFIGITVHSAKVGIFFSEKAQSSELERPITPQHQQKQPRKEQQPSYTRPERSERYERPERQEAQRPYQHQEHPQAKVAKLESEVKTPKVVWTEEMISLVNQWLTDVLRLMNLSHIAFTTQPSHYQVTIVFNKPLIEHGEKEQQLLRNFSMLLIQTLRHKLKRPLRGFKIMMSSK